MRNKIQFQGAPYANPPRISNEILSLFPDLQARIKSINGERIDRTGARFSKFDSAPFCFRNKATVGKKTRAESGLIEICHFRKNSGSIFGGAEQSEK
jgi:hypothetical protein